MARLFGTWLFVLALGLVLSIAAAQEQPKKGKIDIDAVFKKLDTNNDGKLQKDEFLKLCDNFKNKEKAREKLTAAFDLIDVEKVGYLSKAQFQKYLENRQKKEPTP
jgi:Ca2+-binding EF-hand superfamily protein